MWTDSAPSRRAALAASMAVLPAPITATRRPTCVRVLADLGEAESVLAAHRLEPAGHLRVDAGAAFGRLKVLPLLIEFARQHPAVTPHLSLTDRMVDLVDEGIDVAVRIGGSDVWPAPLAQRYLATERLIFCAAPAYLLRRGTPVFIRICRICANSVAW